MPIARATLAKEIDGTITYIYPKTTSDLVEHDPGDSSGNVTVQAAIRSIKSDMTVGIAELNTSLGNYYTKTQVDDLVYEPIEIKSLTVSPTVARAGSSQTVSVSWICSRKPTSMNINGGSVTAAVSGTKTYTSVGSTTTYTMTTTDQKNATASKSATITFIAPFYYGVAATGSTVNDTLIRGFEENVRASLGFSFTKNAGSGNNIWFACPESFSPVFTVNGFSGGFDLINASYYFTNASGYTTNYKVYRSTNAALGSTKVTVS